MPIYETEADRVFERIVAVSIQVKWGCEVECQNEPGAHVDITCKRDGHTVAVVQVKAQEYAIFDDPPYGVCAAQSSIDHLLDEADRLCVTPILCMIHKGHQARWLKVPFAGLVTGKPMWRDRAHGRKEPVPTYRFEVPVFRWLVDMHHKP